jgi:UDP-N-acetylglucosamine/UDP-N-acetylgalactosamine diphosphorylase
MTRSNKPLLDQLVARGVIIHRPEATILEDLDPERIEAGVEIFPGSIVRGRMTLLGEGSRLGQAGGGSFENVALGRRCVLEGGSFQDCVIRDDVRMRVGAEVRRGSLIEEGCRAGHHVGLKMSVLLPYVTVGSLVDFADALMAGGSGPEDFSEIGSSLALYNYTPNGDKFASRFGEVPNGIFLDQPRIFVGGQTQIISPVRVGYGAVIAAGGAVRRDVPSGRLYAEPPRALDERFVQGRYGSLGPKLQRSVEFVGNLKALLLWQEAVRLPLGKADDFVTALNLAAMEALRAGIEERIQRIDRLVEQLPNSIALHYARSLESDADEIFHRRRIKEQTAIIEAWPRLRDRLRSAPDEAASEGLRPVAIAAAAAGLDRLPPDAQLPPLLRDRLDEASKAGVRALLQSVVDRQGEGLDNALSPVRPG